MDPKWGPDIQLVEGKHPFSNYMTYTVFHRNSNSSQLVQDFATDDLGIKTLAPRMYMDVAGIAGWLFPQSYDRY
jgi:hypothetical protein